MWQVFDSGKKSASHLMEKDKKFLLSMKKEDPPTIHFYDFIKPSFTFGVFIKPEQVMNQKVYIKDFDFSKRPTGGGVLFHLWDFAFSCFVPKNHHGYSDDVMECYKYINDRVSTSLEEFIKDKQGGFALLPEDPVPLDDDCKRFCFAKPTKYDVMYGGKKLAGASQRRKEGGYLHQGSISLMMPKFSVIEPLFSKQSRVLEAMDLHTFALLDNSSTDGDVEDAKKAIKKNMVDTLNSC